jgi:hypothetical protein
MTLNEYIKALYKFSQEHPECRDMEVVACDDDEEWYFAVRKTPVMGAFAGSEFLPAEKFEEWDYSQDDANAVCVT